MWYEVQVALKVQSVGQRRRCQYVLPMKARIIFHKKKTLEKKLKLNNNKKKKTF